MNTDNMSNAYGPNTAQVEALIEQVRNLTPEQADALYAAWDTPITTAWVAARAAARDAAQAAARAPAWDAAWDAAWALVVRDLITPEQFNILTAPWVSVMGPLDGEQA